MASKLEPIWALLASQLLSGTSLDVVTVGKPYDGTRWPAAELFPGGGELTETVGTSGQVTDYRGGFTLRIKGTDPESVQLAAEEAFTLWRGVGATPSGLRAALAALGVTQQPKASAIDPPVYRPGGKQTVLVDLDFDIAARWLT